MSSFDSETFCFFPFVHANIRASAKKKVTSCWRSDENLGNLSDNTLSEIWNNDAYKEMRMKFLAGEMPAGCQRCFDLDKNQPGLSLRSWYLKHYKDYYPDIIKDPFNQPLRKIELRFSSLCNYSCLHCDANSSSTWNTKLKKAGVNPFLKPNNDETRVLSESDVDDIITMLASVDEIRITGGEPLMDPVFYYFLQNVPMHYAKNITLLIVSNLSKLHYEDKDALPLFEKFKEVKLRVSYDADEDTYSYFRQGGDPKIVEDNILRIKEYASNISISTVCAVNIFNITRISNIVEFNQKHGLFFKITLVDRPVYLDIRNLPMEKKIEVNAIDMSEFTEHNKIEVERILSFMNSGAKDKWDEFKSYVKWIDGLNGTRFEKVYPEFIGF